MDLLRHGGMDKVFTDVRAPSTLGSFLRNFTFGHVRQLGAVASRALIGLADVVPKLLAGGDGVVMLDIDDTVKPVFGATKQGAQHGYTKVKGLNAQVATISTTKAAPVITAARLRRGAAASAHGAVRLVRDAVNTTRRAGAAGQIMVRADSAFFGHAFVTAVAKTGAWFSVGAGQDKAVRRAIASIDPDAWLRIEYSQAVLDTDTGELVSTAEVAEVPYLAFTSHRTPVQGRLIVRRVPERNTTNLAAAQQEGSFQVWCITRSSPTTPPHWCRRSPSTVVTRSTLCGCPHKIEQVIADLKAGPLAHLPSKSFQTNAAWLAAATIAFNLTRAIRAAAGGKFTKAEGATVRARIIDTPARVS